MSHTLFYQQTLAVAELISYRNLLAKNASSSAFKYGVVFERRSCDEGNFLFLIGCTNILPVGVGPEV